MRFNKNYRTVLNLNCSKVSFFNAYGYIGIMVLNDNEIYYIITLNVGSAEMYKN